MKFDPVENLRTSNRSAHPIGKITRIALLIAMVTAMAMAQTPDLPFSVSNPKHKKWPVDEARRIYFAACEHFQTPWWSWRHAIFSIPGSWRA